MADSADMPQVQTGKNLLELTAIAFILLVTAAGFLVVNLVHMKAKRLTKPPKFSSALDQMAIYAKNINFGMPSRLH
jgi:hypothetical protein